MSTKMTYARIPAFLRSSDAVAVILALLMVFAIAGGRAPQAGVFNVHPAMAECVGTSACAAVELRA